MTGHDDVTFAYDLNGNLIEKNSGGVITRFFYNLEDRLERVEDGSGTVIAEYYYDPFGRRLWKDVSGARTLFHYSDDGLVGEYDTAGAEIKTYGWKPGSTWSTDPLFMKIGTEYYYYHNDHIGTPQKVTSVSGAVVWSSKYSSFGEASIDVGTVTNNLRFPGQYYDQETGLHYNYHRYYNSATGRYLRVDPIGLTGGINPYVYVQNNSITNIDPLGLLFIDGMDCKEIGRKEIPVISSGDQLETKMGTRVMCTEIVIEDTFTCVCIGQIEEVISVTNERCYEVEYECSDSECRHKTIKKTECDDQYDYKYNPLNKQEIRHGTTTSAFGGCSACPGGVGNPM